MNINETKLAYHLLPLQEVILELTTRCNLRCVFCGGNIDLFDRGPEITLDEFSKLLPQITKFGNPIFSIAAGGETTVSPHWKDCVGLLTDVK